MAVTKINRSHNRGRATATNFTSETLLNRGNVDSVQMGVADGALGLILDMLTDISADCGAYAVRETYSNAKDAIRGMKNGRIDITLSVKDDNNNIISRIVRNQNIINDDIFGCFTISDNGIGMSPDDVRNLFLQYGGSNKRDNADSIGSKGLGSKAPLAITDNFMVVTVKNGVETTVNIHRDGDNNSADIQSSSTDKPNGTNVIIPIMSSETYMQINDCIGLLKNNNYDTDLFVNGEPVKKIVDDNDYISSVVKVNDTDSVQVVVSATELLNLVEGRWGSKLDTIFNGSFNYLFDVVIGGYPYSLGTVGNAPSFSPALSVRVFMKPGFFDFTPSRDDIVRNDAFKSFRDFLVEKLIRDGLIFTLVDKVVDTVINDDNLSVLSKVELLTQWKDGVMPSVDVDDNVLDNQYHLTNMLLNPKTYSALRNNDLLLGIKRDASIPRCFIIERDNPYRAFVDDVSINSCSFVYGNLSDMRKSFEETNGTSLDSVIYAPVNEHTIVVYGGSVSDYYSIVRTFASVSRYFSSLFGNQWETARYIFLMDTDEVTNDMKEIIHLTGARHVSSGMLHHKNSIQNIKYYSFEEINNMIITNRAKNKKTHTKIKDFNVIMFDMEDKNKNPEKWETGYTIQDMNEIHDSMIILATSSDGFWSRNDFYTNTLKKSIKDALETTAPLFTKGFLILDAKANHVRTIMNNPNNHILLDKRIGIRNTHRLPQEFTDYHFNRLGKLYMPFNKIMQTTSPIYEQELSTIKNLNGYTHNIITNILLGYYANTNEPTDTTDTTIINILKELTEIHKIINDTEYSIDYKHTNTTDVTTIKDALILTIIELMNSKNAEYLVNLYKSEANNDSLQKIFYNTIIQWFQTKTKDTTNEWYQTHENQS